MPCYSPDYRDELQAQREASLCGNIGVLQNHIGVLQDSADAATRAACDLRTILRRGGKESDLCPETLEWIKNHDKWDELRIKQEDASGERDRVKREALNKLTLDERRALGL